MRTIEVERNARRFAGMFTREELLEKGELNIRFDESIIEFSTYAGNCLHIYPSGKYYMPWATSNLELCPRCKNMDAKRSDCKWCGGLGCREAYLDEVFREVFDEGLGEKNLWSGGSEGDGCDVIVGTCLDFIEDDPEDAVEEIIAEDPDILEDRRQELLDVLNEAVETDRRWHPERYK